MRRNKWEGKKGKSKEEARVGSHQHCLSVGGARDEYGEQQRTLTSTSTRFSTSPVDSPRPHLPLNNNPAPPLPRSSRTSPTPPAPLSYALHPLPHSPPPLATPTRSSPFRPRRPAPPLSISLPYREAIPTHRVSSSTIRQERTLADENPLLPLPSFSPSHTSLVMLLKTLVALAVAAVAVDATKILVPLCVFLPQFNFTPRLTSCSSLQLLVLRVVLAPAASRGVRLPFIPCFCRPSLIHPLPPAFPPPVSS